MPQDATVLRWLHLHAVNAVDTAKIVESVPDHCVDYLVNLASRCSSNWAQIAHELARRASQPQARVTA
jgi:hypothetical protein